MPTEGDILVLTRLDRLGRSLRDLAHIVHEIEAAGANLRVIEQSVDTATSAGRAFFGTLAVSTRLPQLAHRVNARQRQALGRRDKSSTH